MYSPRSLGGTFFDHFPEGDFHSPGGGAGVTLLCEMHIFSEVWPKRACFLIAPVRKRRGAKMANSPCFLEACEFGAHFAEMLHFFSAWNFSRNLLPPPIIISLSLPIYLYPLRELPSMD